MTGTAPLAHLYSEGTLVAPLRLDFNLTYPDNEGFTRSWNTLSVFPEPGHPPLPHSLEFNLMSPPDSFGPSPSCPTMAAGETGAIYSNS